MGQHPGDDQARLTSARLPFLALILAVFSLGTGESVIAGLLPILAEDLDVSLPMAGLLVSGYALVVVVAGPVVTLATASIPPQRLLVALGALFTAGNVATALAPTYLTLVAARMVCALAHCTLFAVALTIAGRLAPPHKTGSAVAKVIIGINLATVLGVPLGVAVADQLGWRSTFWGVAAASALSVIIAQRTIRADVAPAGGAVGLRTLLDRRIQIVLAVTALGMAGAFTAFIYLTALLVQITGFAVSSLGPVLLSFGLGSCVGSWLGGRLADRARQPATTLVLAALAAVLAALAAGANLQPLTVGLLFLFGVAFFALNPLLGARIIALSAGSGPTLALAVNVCAVQIAIAFSGWIGGQILNTGLDTRAIILCGGLLAALGMLLSLLDPHDRGSTGSS